MKFRVVVTARATNDLRAAYLRAAQHAPQTAKRWFNRFEAALQTLSSHPQRCSLAPESETANLEIRQFLFGKGRSIYRALFTVQDEEVSVLHIRWGGREFATPDELFE
jgi:plasmid stabilization system protein ParE